MRKREARNGHLDGFQQKGTAIIPQLALFQGADDPVSWAKVHAQNAQLQTACAQRKSAFGIRSSFLQIWTRLLRNFGFLQASCQANDSSKDLIVIFDLLLYSKKY